ncbi:hypothetical protein [Texcoconibacillus texcoconensis]|uniref:Uncharacterized protein n=1 Tax=Texcoconibacillus texcoconensis TaxID=1095777 RepID=A0A840QS79_9BACI|nr:hypothetical protein [Texcoconibacillus texcoconensis]MBB5174200.1 hypothetical protein [Texcoconibacillus texcoconensis]
MKMNTYSTEVTDWFLTLALFVSIAVGWGVGPVGWANNALTASNAIIVFADLTSNAYADDDRLIMSEAATNHLNNAREIAWAPGAFDNYDFDIVDGFGG